MFKAKLKLESGNEKIQYCHHVAESQQASAYDHHQHAYEVWNWNSKANLTYTPETMPPAESRNRKIQYGCQAAILKMTLLKINRLLPIYISIVLLKFEVDFQSQSKVRVWKQKKSNMATRRTDKVNPVYPPPTSLSGGMIMACHWFGSKLLPKPMITGHQSHPK